MNNITEEKRIKRKERFKPISFSLYTTFRFIALLFSWVLILAYMFLSYELLKDFDFFNLNPENMRPVHLNLISHGIITYWLIVFSNYCLMAIIKDGFRKVKRFSEKGMLNRSFYLFRYMVPFLLLLATLYHFVFSTRGLISNILVIFNPGMITGAIILFVGSFWMEKEKPSKKEVKDEK